MFTIRNNKIFKIDKIVKSSKRGTSLWCQLQGYNKYYLISCLKIYDSFSQAQNTLNNKIKLRSF
jgi:hypothetical protein